MTTLEVERIGGLAGFGLPGSKLRAGAECEFEKLNAADRNAIATLLGGGPMPAEVGGDQFRVRLTLRGDGSAKSVEVPEDRVPRSVTKLIRSELL